MVDFPTVTHSEETEVCVFCRPKASNLLALARSIDMLLLVETCLPFENKPIQRDARASLLRIYTGS